MPYSPVAIGVKIVRIILGLIALLVIVEFLFSFYYNQYSLPETWQSTVVSLIVVWVLYWLVGKAEYGWERHQEAREQRLIGLINTYGKISLKDLSGKLDISINQTEELIVRLRGLDRIDARIEDGNVISGSGQTPVAGHFCTKCGKPLTVVSGRWWCENCKIAAAEEVPATKEVIKEREIVMVACKHCGTRNLQTSTFCSHCGASL